MAFWSSPVMPRFRGFPDRRAFLTLKFAGAGGLRPRKLSVLLKDLFTWQLYEIRRAAAPGRATDLNFPDPPDALHKNTESIPAFVLGRFCTSNF
jgi:hypothetical protein